MIDNERGQNSLRDVCVGGGSSLSLSRRQSNTHATALDARRGESFPTCTTTGTSSAYKRERGKRLRCRRYKNPSFFRPAARRHHAFIRSSSNRRRALIGFLHARVCCEEDSRRIMSLSLACNIRRDKYKSSLSHMRRCCEGYADSEICSLVLKTSECISRLSDEYIQCEGKAHGRV